MKVLIGDCRETLTTLHTESVQCCVTSPPYFGLRDYGHEGQMGMEATPELYVAGMVAVFREVRRVLKDDGLMWLNIGDSYNAKPGQRKATDKAGDKQSNNAGSVGIGSRSVNNCKPKDLIGIPWLLAFALRADGWYLRQDIIWAKPNPMPESVTDRCTKSHEYLFLISKSERYFYDNEAIKEKASGRDPGNQSHKYTEQYEQDESEMHRTKAGLVNCGAKENRNKRSVWTVPTVPYTDAHFATYPPDLIKPCILAGSRPGDTILDPFGGSGTTGMVAIELGRKAILCELNPDYAGLIKQRANTTPGLGL